MERLVERWRSWPLAKQFLLAGGAVSTIAAVLVGIYVANLIEDAVTRNSAAATALYVDSVIAPILPDMLTTNELDDTVRRALDETLGQGALGKRLRSFRLWRADGTVLYANEHDMIGRKIPVNADLERAFAGTMVANFNNVDDEQSAEAQREGIPVLEIYNPVLQPWSGKVVAVSEFYEAADDFSASLQRALALSWLAVFGFTVAFFVLLSVVVVRGSRTIETQRSALNERIKELSTLLQQNDTLRERVQKASQRATELNESVLRRIGADLHDGPAQLVAYALLRLDSSRLIDPATPPAIREAEIVSVQTSLDDAMTEIRNICGGLVLPQIEAAGVADIVKRAVRDHIQRTGSHVELLTPDEDIDLPLPGKICLYRFVQESLNNAYRHAHGIGQRVAARHESARLNIEVSDRGGGFDPDKVAPSRIGIAGLRDRVASLGGTFDLLTSPQGTSVRMSLDVAELKKVS